MAKRSVHVVPAPDGGWSVRKGGAARASKHFTDKSSAVGWGRNVSKANGTEFFIHRRDGTIHQKNSYGNDPLPPRDKR